MQDALERFQRYLERRYGDRSTPKHYRSDLRVWVRQLGPKRPQEVTMQDIDQFVDGQVAQGLKPTTINRRLATLRTFFEFLAGEEPDHPWPNPVIWRRHRVKAGETLPRDLTEAVVDRLFAVIADDRDRALFGLMLGAGLRVSEVAALRLSDLEEPSAADQMARLRVLGKGRKERCVWLVAPLYATVQTWLQQRPAGAGEPLFVNQQGRPLSASGLQFRLRQHAAAAGVTVTCHQLRHTFARRLAEQEFPVESLAKLLGHAQVQTTQVYVAGADVPLRQAFAQAMARLEEASPAAAASTEATDPFLGALPRLPERANPEELRACWPLLEELPAWLQEPLQAYLTWRWRNWQPHLAGAHAPRLARQLRGIWAWLVPHQTLTGWADLHRSHLEAWLESRQEAGLAVSTQRHELSSLLSFLRFVAEQGTPLSDQLFRVAYPPRPEALPRALSEAEYRRLEQVVLEQTAAATPQAARDRAWFLTLAHTGLRLGELLHLSWSDLDLAGGRLWVRGGKQTRDRVVYLTPRLTQALHAHATHQELRGEPGLWPDRAGSLQDQQVRYRLRQWGRQAQVQVSPHRLRHTWATRLINQGLSLEALRRLLGHRHLSMTQQYARLYDTTVQHQFQAAMARLEAGPGEEASPSPADSPPV